MTRHKPFTRTEMKILVYNKMKMRGLSHDLACKELEQEIKEIIENSKEKHVKEIKPKKDKFKKEFSKLTNGKKR